MKNGICAKCGHKDVRTGIQEAMLVGLGQSKSLLGMHISSANMSVSYNVYVCVGCGYVEFGLSDAGDLQEIVKAWPRVGS